MGTELQLIISNLSWRGEWKVILAGIHLTKNTNKITIRNINKTMIYLLPLTFTILNIGGNENENAKGVLECAEFINGLFCPKV